MIQFVYTALLGALIYTIGLLITDGTFMPMAGFLFSALVTVIFVLPLRLVLKLLMPGDSQQARALIAVAVLLAPATLAALTLPTMHMPSGRLGFFVFWLIYLSTLVIAQFWPLSTQAAQPPPLAAARRTSVSDNTSGHGPAAPVPAEIDRWNWGAFLLNWIWGIGNNTFVALLMFVPLVNLGMLFVLGAKGSAWAWRNKHWDSIEHFQHTQRAWTRWSLALYAVVFVFGFGIVAITLKTSAAYELGVVQLQSHREANAALGSPIEAGFPLGHIEVSGGNGSAVLSFSAQGPLARGKVYLTASKQYGEWKLDEIELDVEGQPHIIPLIATSPTP